MSNKHTFRKKNQGSLRVIWHTTELSGRPSSPGGAGAHHRCWHDHGAARVPRDRALRARRAAARGAAPTRRHAAGQADRRVCLRPWQRARARQEGCHLRAAVLRRPAGPEVQQKAPARTRDPHSSRQRGCCETRSSAGTARRNVWPRHARRSPSKLRARQLRRRTRSRRSWARLSRASASAPR